MLVSVLIFTLVAVLIGWFATSGLRADRAEQFSNEAVASLQAGNLEAAYRQAEFAYALKTNDQRATTLGAIAYLRGDYRNALRYFRRSQTPEGAVGQAAAAGQLGDMSAYRAARDRAGQLNRPLSVGLASAAILAGNGDAAAALDKPISNEARFAKAIGVLATDRPLAANILAQPACDCAGPAEDLAAAGQDAYRKFLETLTAIPPNGEVVISQAIIAAGGPASSASQLTILAQGLYQIGYFRQSAALAEQAVRQAPRYRDGWQQLAAAQIMAGDYVAANRSVKTALDLDPASGYTWFLKAELATRQNKPDDAAASRKQATELGYQAP